MKKANIGTVALLQRKIMVELPSSAASVPPKFHIDGIELQSKEMPTAQLEKVAIPLSAEFRLQSEHSRLQVLAMDGSPTGATVDAYENKLSEWAVSDGRTIQIKLQRNDSQYQLRIGPKIGVRLKPEHQAPEFRALVASHRLNAHLVVTFTSSETGAQSSIEIAVNPVYMGGKSSSGYQEIVVKSPIRSNCTVSLSLVCDGTSDHDTDTPSFFFMANARVVAASTSSSVFQPHITNHMDVNNGVWFFAELPGYLEEGGGSIKIEHGDELIEIISLSSNRVSLVEEFGHALNLKAMRAQEMILTINGAPIETLTVNESDTYVQLPAKYLTGEVIVVALFDLSGSQILFSLPLIGKHIVTPESALRQWSKPPYPVELTTREGFRYRGMRAIMRADSSSRFSGTLVHAIDALDAGIEKLSFESLNFPVYEKPTVSIVIPVHNNANFTYHCLCALMVAHNETSFEVIVVDDGSTDSTIDLANIISGVKFIRHDTPQRFIRACNSGAIEARGEYIVLLNNDTEPTVGWLDALVQALQTMPNAGLVGSKLLYPDGRLQDAGGIVWSSGNPWNYGNGHSPWHPKFSYTRKADYLSGAALMTTKSVWETVGGLSSYLEPMYFEDTDLSFKVREAGFSTYFVPSSVVYHYEGMTSGTDTTSGFKRFQEVNRPKFKKRWAGAFSKNGREGESVDLEKDRNTVGRVLFVDSGVPREDRDAGSYAARREIELVQSLGYKVTFVPQNLAHLGVYTDGLAETGVEVIYAPFYRTIREFFEERGSEFDVVYMTRYHVAQAVLPLVRQFSPKAKTILNNADLHFLRELRAAMNSRDPNRFVAMRHVRDQELSVMKEVDLVLSYNEVEHAVIASHTDGEARVMECPWVVKIPQDLPVLKGRSGLSFLGNFTHRPNREGITWFCKEVMPALSGDAANLFIYGSELDQEIEDLANDKVHPIGYIADQAEAFNVHRVFIAPLLSGAGIKGKVVSALAHGIPTVLTPLAAEGIGVRNGEEVIIAVDENEWIEAINLLSSNDQFWSRMSLKARDFAAQRFSFARGKSLIEGAFNSLDLFGRN